LEHSHETFVFAPSGRGVPYTNSGRTSSHIKSAKSSATFGSDVFVQIVVGNTVMVSHFISFRRRPSDRRSEFQIAQRKFLIAVQRADKPAIRNPES
jgi:hypothetical protein